MANQLENFFSGLSGLFWQMNGRQKMELLMVSAVTILALTGLVWWAGQPDWEVLFYEVSAPDAARVVTALQEEGVSYKLAAGGETILVPSKRVEELRLSMAERGLPESGYVGYEIFDQSNLGMSDFVQKINYRRALEGELSKTLSQMVEVKSARVHIVIPEEKLFKEDQQQPSASVILNLARTTVLSSAQVRGITKLISSSIEGLSTDNITVVNSFGDILYSGEKSNSPLAGTSEQLAMQEQVEEYLANKAQAMLSSVVGQGNSIVRISAELDFERIERTSEIYDPDGQVIRTEQLETTNTTSQDTSEMTGETSMTKYEINRTLEKTINSIGNVKLLTVAVLVNGRYTPGPDNPDGTPGTPVYSPRSSQEIANLTSIVRNAVGFNSNRGDEIELLDMQFEAGGLLATGFAPEEITEELNYFDIGKKVGMGLAALLVLLMIRSMAKKAAPIRMTRTPGAGLAPVRIPNVSSAPQNFPAVTSEPLPSLEEGVLPEAMERTRMQSQLTNYASDNAMEATSLLRSWLMEN